MRCAVGLALTALLICVLAGCNKQTTEQTGSIQIDGSSTVYPVSNAVAIDFQREKNVKVTVGISGTTGGFKKFCRGETDISNASRPILKDEMEEARKNGIEYVELPISFDALTVAVNSQNDWCNSLTVDELKKLWEPEAQGKITHWNQIRPEWPNEKITLYGADTESGTFDYFTEAIVGKARSSRSDYVASDRDEVLTKGVLGNKYALGYIPFAYYEEYEGKLKPVAIQWDKNKVKEPVLPSKKAVVNGTYNPLSRPLFIYVNKKSAERKEVKEFVEFFLFHGPQIIEDVKYIRLPADAYDKSRDRFRKMETGTAFGGVQEIGLPLEDIFKRTPKP